MLDSEISQFIKAKLSRHSGRCLAGLKEVGNEKTRNQGTVIYYVKYKRQKYPEA